MQVGNTDSIYSEFYRNVLSSAQMGTAGISFHDSEVGKRFTVGFKMLLVKILKLKLKKKNRFL